MLVFGTAQVMIRNPSALNTSPNAVVKTGPRSAQRRGRRAAGDQPLQERSRKSRPDVRRAVPGHRPGDPPAHRQARHRPGLPPLRPARADLVRAASPTCSSGPRAGRRGPCRSVASARSSSGPPGGWSRRTRQRSGPSGWWQHRSPSPG